MPSDSSCEAREPVRGEPMAGEGWSRRRCSHLLRPLGELRRAWWGDLGGQLGSFWEGAGSRLAGWRRRSAAQARQRHSYRETWRRSLLIIGRPSSAPWGGGRRFSRAPCPRVEAGLGSCRCRRACCGAGGKCLFCATAEVASCCVQGTRMALCRARTAPAAGME